MKSSSSISFTALSAVVLALLAPPRPVHAQSLPTAAEIETLDSTLAAIDTTKAQRLIEVDLRDIVRGLERDRADDPLKLFALKARVVDAAVGAGLVFWAVQELDDLDRDLDELNDPRAADVLRFTVVETAEVLMAAGEVGGARGLFRREIFRDGVEARIADEVRLMWAMAELQAGTRGGARIASRLAEQVAESAKAANRQRHRTVASWISVMAAGESAATLYAQTSASQADPAGSREAILFPLVVAVLTGAEDGVLSDAAERVLASGAAVSASDLSAAAALVSQRLAALEVAARLADRAIERAAGDADALEIARLTRAKIAIRAEDDPAALGLAGLSTEEDLGLEFGWSYDPASADRSDPPVLIFRLAR